jgi:hypothetical protein
LLILPSDLTDADPTLFLFAVIPIFYTSVVQEMCNRDLSPEVDDVEGLAAAATKHLDLLEQKDEDESSFIALRAKL